MKCCSTLWLWSGPCSAILLMLLYVCLKTLQKHAKCNEVTAQLRMGNIGWYCVLLLTEILLLCAWTQLPCCVWGQTTVPWHTTCFTSSANLVQKLYILKVWKWSLEKQIGSHILSTMSSVWAEKIETARFWTQRVKTKDNRWKFLALLALSVGLVINLALCHFLSFAWFGSRRFLPSHQAQAPIWHIFRHWANAKVQAGLTMPWDDSNCSLAPCHGSSDDSPCDIIHVKIWLSPRDVIWHHGKYCRVILMSHMFPSPNVPHCPLSQWTQTTSWMVKLLPSSWKIWLK